MKETTRTKLFSTLLAAFPLLSVYRSVIPGVDLGTVLLLLFCAFSLSTAIYRNDVNPLLLYILIVTPLVLLGSSDYEISITTILLRYAKMVISLVIVFLFGYFQKYYDEEKVFLWMKRVIYVSCAFVVLQRICYLFGMTLQNPFIRFASYEGYTDGYQMMSGSIFRPSAFFLEPSHLSVYGLVFLIYSLFQKDDLKDAAIVSLAILCTGSGIGLVMTALVFIIYCLLKFRKHLVRTLGLVIGGAIMAGWMLTLPFFQQVILRFTTENTVGG